MKISPTLSEYGLPGHCHHHVVVLPGDLGNGTRQMGDAVVCQHAIKHWNVIVSDLENRPRLLREQSRQHRVRCLQFDLKTATTRKSHLTQRDEKTTI